MMMNSGAARPALVNRITAANNPATPKRATERQYLARLMRPLAPNRNSNRSSMVPRHADAPAEPAHDDVSFRNRNGFKAGMAPLDAETDNDPDA